MTQLPIIASKTPFKVEVEAGKKYFFCTCGASTKQPFCDGSHKKFTNIDGSLQMKPLLFEASESKSVYFCGCKHSKQPILCDGSHKNLS